ncbi:efflux RND transporter periplasmic adaptor subunit [Undibacterium sp. RuRC25W]|uniref:efflux RND transporter periplasmic adaptor subunit n=1 Tax=Undibacterium sp. RuRC25W TaxID=3413047 RepID=UPI003BF22C34
MLRKTLIAIAIASTLAACNNNKEPEKTAASSTTSAAEKNSADKKEKAIKLLIAPEDTIKIGVNAMVSGPVVTGSIQPERKADLRSEVQAIVLQVLKENGDVVKRGDILVRLDETAIRDNLNSAEDNVRSVTLSLEQADRAQQRLKTLRASGMASLQALDDAEVKVDAARSELSASKARATTARQQLQRTVVRAPFDGVVSERKVSAGDTASLGKELVKVIDPSSMRFIGNVSADRISQVKVGQAVVFRVNGYANQDFHGKVTRVDPAANDVTRQVEVLVSFADSNQPKVAGLYAEGNIESTTVDALTLPEGAIVKAGDKSYAWQIVGKNLKKVDLVLGKRDQRTGNVEIRHGLASGDLVMRSPSSNLKDEQEVEMAATKVAASSTNRTEGN